MLPKWESQQLMLEGNFIPGCCMEKEKKKERKKKTIPVSIAISSGGELFKLDHVICPGS